jgi:hypothetical protein
MISLKNSDMVNTNFSCGRYVFDEFGALILGLNYGLHKVFKIGRICLRGVGSLP